MSDAHLTGHSLYFDVIAFIIEQLHASLSEESPEQSGGIEKGSRLPYAEWAGVYRNLRVFLRPYGNPNEGRLDFYHRTLSKVVQEK